MGGFQNFFEIGSKPMLWVRFPLTTLFLWTISWKDQFFNFSQWIWIFSEFWKIMKMIYLDCQWIDLFPVIKCCRDVLWRHINLLYIYLTVVYLAGWNYHSLKFSKISQNFIFSQKFTIKIRPSKIYRKIAFQRDWSQKTVTKYYELRPHVTIFDQTWPVLQDKTTQQAIKNS